MKARVLWAGAAILVVGGIVAVGLVRKGAQKTPVVQTARVARRMIVQKVSGTGTIQPHTQIKISADVSAKIEKLGVVEGEWVEKGAFLVALDRERYLAAVESA